MTLTDKSAPTQEKTMANQDLAQIGQATAHLDRMLAVAASQRDNASAAGYALAQTVARYVENPQEVGRAALRDAYSAFMARHAGNWSG